MSNKNPGRPSFSNGIGWHPNAAANLLSSVSDVSLTLSDSFDTLSRIPELAADANAAAVRTHLGRLTNWLKYKLDGDKDNIS